MWTIGVNFHDFSSFFFIFWMITKTKELALSNLEVVGEIRTPIEYLVELLRTEADGNPNGSKKLWWLQVITRPRYRTMKTNMTPTCQPTLLWGSFDFFFRLAWHFKRRRFFFSTILLARPSAWIPSTLVGWMAWFENGRSRWSMRVLDGVFGWKKNTKTKRRHGVCWSNNYFFRGTNTTKGNKRLFFFAPYYRDHNQYESWRVNTIHRAFECGSCKSRKCPRWHLMNLSFCFKVTLSLLTMDTLKFSGSYLLHHHVVLVGQQIQLNISNLNYNQIPSSCAVGLIDS